MNHFDYRSGELHVEGVPVSAVAEAVGTPVYIYSSATLERHYRVFAAAFDGLPTTICYAVKANSNLAVIRTLAALGAGADVVSEGELRRALAVDDRVSETERLRHVDHGFIASGISVWVKLADHVTDCARRFFWLRRRTQAQLTHRIDDAPLHRLQTVAYERQCPVEDDVHGVIQVRLFRKRFERLLLYAFKVQFLFSHGFAGSLI